MRMINEISNFIFIQDKLEKADIIFIPGGSYPELGEYAAQLYHLGYAPLIMPTGGVSIKTGQFNGVKARQEIYNKNYRSDCEFLTDVLTINHVPPTAIIGEDKSAFTKENAYFSRKVLELKNITIQKAILCCKNFHARRVLMCYQFAFPEVEFFVAPTSYYEEGIDITKDNWHHTEVGINRVLGEMDRCSKQFVEEFKLFANHERS